MKNSCWHDNSSGLCEETTPGTKSSLALLIQPILKEEDETSAMDGKSNQAESRKYDCPLFGAWHSSDQSDDNVIWHIPLPTSDSVTLWAQKRASMVLSPIEVLEK